MKRIIISLFMMFMLFTALFAVKEETTIPVAPEAKARISVLYVLRMDPVICCLLCVDAKKVFVVFNIDYGTIRILPMEGNCNSEK